jgi:predicted nucleic acid-binding protein
MVVDAGILSAVVTEPAGPAGRAIASAPSMEAPELYVLEVASSLRNQVIRNVISVENATRAIARLQRLPIIRHPLLPLLDRVWELSQNLTPYDAAYVALAERLRVALLTTDAGIARAPGLRCKVRLVKL